MDPLSRYIHFQAECRLPFRRRDMSRLLYIIPARILLLRQDIYGRRFFFSAFYRFVSESLLLLPLHGTRDLFAEYKTFPFPCRFAETRQCLYFPKNQTVPRFPRDNSKKYMLIRCLFRTHAFLKPFPANALSADAKNEVLRQ